MVDNCSFTGKVAEIIPESVYQGRTYTQDVVFQLGNNIDLRVSDASEKCSEKMIGETVEFGLRGISVQNVAKGEAGEFELKPVDVGYSSGISFISGRVTARNLDNDQSVGVSCGFGEIELELVVDQADFIKCISIGDFITAETISEVYLSCIRH